jgi:hypothetical protein
MDNIEIPSIMDQKVALMLLGIARSSWTSDRRNRHPNKINKRGISKEIN